jgi:hypothetical protein
MACRKMAGLRKQSHFGERQKISANQRSPISEVTKTGKITA